MNMLRLLPVAGMLLSLGCGGDAGISVQGKLVRGNADFAIPDGQKYVLQLTGPGGSYSAEVDGSGTFSPRNDRGGPTAGTYEALVTIYREGNEGTTAVNLIYTDPVTVSRDTPTVTLDVTKFK